jgi:DNA repair ATPase RecN
MALCNVKDGNVVQAMQQAQTRAVDQWAYYQAKSTKEAMAENAAELLSAQRDTSPSLSREGRTALETRIATLQASAKRYDKEKGEIKAEAERLEKSYDTLNTHDDQFDMAEAGFTVAMALFGITILSQRRWMLVLACCFSAFGFVMGLAGFLQASLHPDWLAKLLG